MFPQNLHFDGVSFKYKELNPSFQKMTAYEISNIYKINRDLKDLKSRLKLIPIIEESEILSKIEKQEIRELILELDDRTKSRSIKAKKDEEPI